MIKGRGTNERKYRRVCALSGRICASRWSCSVCRIVIARDAEDGGKVPLDHVSMSGLVCSYRRARAKSGRALDFRKPSQVTCSSSATCNDSETNWCRNQKHICVCYSLSSQ